ncbi:MAG: hypothetical protein FRX49_10194 [Trebouxia sp. A1-2]|nr:MAG: hypothetical protein FRX49_10194 [Trebouxia sp. A1-2]
MSRSPQLQLESGQRGFDQIPSEFRQMSKVSSSSAPRRSWSPGVAGPTAAASGLASVEIGPADG